MSEVDLYKKLIEDHWIESEFWDERRCGCGELFTGEDSSDAIQHHFLRELFWLWCAYNEKGRIWDGRWSEVDHALGVATEKTPEWMYARGQMDHLEEVQALVMNELWDRYLA